MSDLFLKRENFNQAPALDQFKDRTVFQTQEWLEFVAKSQNAELVVAVVMDGNKRVGRFSGLIVNKFGLRILGSPFPGWTTNYMGFNLIPSISRKDALLALEKFAFTDLKCVHIEIMDRFTSEKDFSEAGYRYRLEPGFEIDLTRDDEIIFNSMAKNARWSVRKAIKCGVKIEMANDVSFADDYYAQLEDVFAKRKMVPTYPKKRVQSLIEHLLPTGHLLLMRAIINDGKCIATGIFPALNDMAYCWGGASWRSHQSYQPNEMIQWHAMCYWKERGISRYDMGGGGDHKRKYGGADILVPRGSKSKFLIIEDARDVAKKLVEFRHHLLGLRKN